MKFKIPITAERFEALRQSDAASEEKKKLDEELKELGKLASNAVNEAVRKEYGAEYMKGDERTDDELEKQAEENARKKVENENRELEKTTAEKIGDLSGKAENKKNALSESEREISARYDEAKKQASNEALKRGLGRSSIILNLIKEYDEGKFKDIGERKSVAAKELEEIDGEIERLGKELKNSLEKTDLKTAFELNELLTELKKSRDEANEKALVYNNTLAGKLADFRRKIENSGDPEMIVENARAQSDAYYDEMLKKIVAYYSKLDSDSVAKDFETGGYDSIFSPETYKKLKTYVASRK